MKRPPTISQITRLPGWLFATPQGNTGPSPHYPPPGQLPGLRCRQVCSGDCHLGYLAAPGAAWTLLWRQAPGLVVRRQSPKALQILEGKRLEPQALQGSLPDSRSAKEGQVGALGVSRTKCVGGGGARGGQILGGGSGRADLGRGASPCFQVKGKSLPRGPLARPVQCPAQRLGQWH